MTNYDRNAQFFKEYIPTLMERATRTYDETGKYLPVPKRFIDAEKGDVKKAIARWEDTLKYRSEQKIWSIFQEPIEKFEIIQEYYPNYFHHTSKCGNIMYFVEAGKINFSKLKKENISFEMLLRHYLFLCEFQWSHLTPEESSRTVSVIDLKGVGISSLFDKKLLGWFSKTNQLYARHYPEKSHKIIIVNTPFSFYAAWRMVRPMLDPVTVEKVNIVRSGKATRDALLEVADSKYIPEKYGGTSSELGTSPEYASMVELQSILSQGARLPTP